MVTADVSASLAPLRPLLLGWDVGVGLLVVGVAGFAVALGFFVFGLLLLPFVFLLWIGAAAALAVGHVAYRLRTCVHPDR